MGPSMTTKNLDDLHGLTVVAQIDIKMDRAGNMRVAGSITDEKAALAMLDAAKDVLRNYHAKQKLGLRSPVVVPAYDTALTGTEYEKKLLAARHQLADAMT